MHTYDVIIIGAGPIGMACAIELKKKDVEAKILEKGAPVENIRKWPQGMTFFSTPEKINLGDIPFTTHDMRPTREEALKYYNSLIDYFRLDIEANTLVTDISKEADLIRIATNRGEYQALNVIIATGYYDQPNLLGVPGEELPHVSHYLRDPYKYVHSRVMVVGGSHSAADAALDLYRLGSDVVMVHRGPKLKEKLKYWIKPDLENRIKEGSIEAHFNSNIRKIEQERVTLWDHAEGQEKQVDADFVLLLTGYKPNVSLLKTAGIETEEDSLIPTIDEITYESNVEGIYLAGSITAGRHVSQIFIENGREHAKAIASAIEAKMEKVQV